MDRRTLHDAWAEVLGYPQDEGGARAVRATLGALATRLPELADDLRPLAEYAVSAGNELLQERYTSTFDGSTSRALELGWHLFGESYSRGAFLVRMRQLLAEHGLVETGELPDHLGCVLGVLGRAPEDLAAALVRGSVLPALDKIVAGFGDAADPYRAVLVGLRRFLDNHHAAPAAAVQEVRRS